MPAGTSRRSHSIAILTLLAMAVLAAACSRKGAGGGAPSARQNPAQSPTVIAVRAARATVPIYQEFIGQTEAVNTVEVRSQVNGFLQSIDFKEGATVHRDQLLFQIDPRQYEAAVEQARGQLDQTRAALNNSQKDLQRDRILFKTQVVSRQTLDTANAQTEEARANVKAAQAALDEALLNLGYTNIHAPITGRIGVAQVKVGALVQQGTTLLDTIYSIDPIYVTFSVTEQTYLRYAEMAAKADHAPPPPPVQLLLPGNQSYEYEGKIDMSTPSVNSSTGTLGVRAVFPNPQGILRAGLFVRVRLMVREERDAVMVPVKTITEVQGRQQVLIAGADNRVELRQVTAGAVVGNMRVIASGVRPGERVIVEGLQKAQPGMTVNVEERPAPAISARNQEIGQSAQQPLTARPQASAPADSGPAPTIGPSPASSPAPR